MNWMGMGMGMALHAVLMLCAQAMQLDAANYQLQSLAPFLVEHGARYERDNAMERLGLTAENDPELAAKLVWLDPLSRIRRLHVLTSMPYVSHSQSRSVGCGLRRMGCPGRRCGQSMLGGWPRW
jgi:hypothetical protein